MKGLLFAFAVFAALATPRSASATNAGEHDGMVLSSWSLNNSGLLMFSFTQNVCGAANGGNTIYMQAGRVVGGNTETSDMLKMVQSTVMAAFIINKTVNIFTYETGSGWYCDFGWIAVGP